MMNWNRFKIGFACSDSEKACVHDFVSDVYSIKYGTRPQRADSYAVVYRNDRIVGCLGAMGADEDGSFLIERIYKLKRGGVTESIAPHNCVQLVRWASIERDAGACAVFYAVCNQMKSGKLFALIDCTKRVRSLLESIGVHCAEIPFDSIDLSAVGEDDRPPYAMGILAPYRLDLSQMRLGLGEMVGENPRFEDALV